MHWAIAQLVGQVHTPGFPVEVSLTKGSIPFICKNYECKKKKKESKTKCINVIGWALFWLSL